MIYRRYPALVILCYSATLLLSACDALDKSIGTHLSDISAGAKSSLSHSSWTLVNAQIVGKSISNPSVITMIINGEQLTGYSGVNHYAAKIKLTRNRFSILDGAIAVTQIAGDIALMHAESSYLSALQHITQYQEHDGKLELLGENVTLTYQKTPQPQ